MDQLVKDAEIFVPMVPLMTTTEGVITGNHIRALPKGCLVVLCTRANICDMSTLRQRVQNDELSLAADVFDVEPLALNDPLLLEMKIDDVIKSFTKQADLIHSIMG